MQARVQLSHWSALPECKIYIDQKSYIRNFYVATVYSKSYVIF